MESTCAVCEKPFQQTKKYHVQTCSKECAKRWRAQKMADSYATMGTWLTGTCASPHCDNEFKYRRSKPQKYCSKTCYNRMVSESAERERVCARPGCGNVMTNYARQEQRFCSVTCRNKSVAAQRQVNFPKCLVCGISTESYNRIYCDEHRPMAGRAAMPRKVAICLGCGEEFSRPGYWRGKMKYCSNKCSHRESKAVRDKYVVELNDKAVVFHSMWEVRFAAVCDQFGISWRRYDGPDVKTPVGIYRPDFIIGDDALVVEIKANYNVTAQAKVKAYRENVGKLALIMKPELAELESAKNAADVMSTLQATCHLDPPTDPAYWD